MTVGIVRDIMITALEGGINYWGELDNTTSEFDMKPKGVAASEWAAEIIINGGEILIRTEDEEVFTLTLVKLITGMMSIRALYDIDLEDIDAEEADMIIQKAIFDELVYG